MEQHEFSFLPDAIAWVRCSTASPWREHWMECVQVMAQPLDVAAGQPCRLRARHDDYDMSFALTVGPAADGAAGNAALALDVCKCRAHPRLNRHQIGRLNDPHRWR